MKNSIKKTLTLLLNNNKVIFSKIYYAGSGDTTFSGWIPFNHIETNIGGGTWSNGRYTVPEAGYYIANFTCYSNHMAQGRVAVKNLNRGEMSMCNQNQSTSISGIFKCEAGDVLVAGAYNSNYPLSLYAAAGHNSFTIMRILG